MAEQTMNPEIKAEWLRRLRSGGYTQGRYSLKKQTPDGEMLHCCLGVLCEIAAEAGVVTTGERADIEADGTVYTFNLDAGLLPREVSEWAGLFNRSSPSLDNSPVNPIPEVAGTNLAHNESIHLTELNDMRFDFNTIANLIERYL